MSFIVDEKIEEYAERHSTPPDPLLAELAEETKATMSAPQMLTGSAPKPGCSAAVPLVNVIDPPVVMRGANTRTAVSAPTKRVWKKPVMISGVRSASGASSSVSPAVNTRCSISPRSAASRSTAARSVRSTVAPRA